MVDVVPKEAGKVLELVMEELGSEVRIIME